MNISGHCIECTARQSVTTTIESETFEQVYCEICGRSIDVLSVDLTWAQIKQIVAATSDIAWVSPGEIEGRSNEDRLDLVFPSHLLERLQQISLNGDTNEEEIVN